MRPLLLTTAALALSLALPAPAAQLYQWKDAQGRTHYGDQPPPPETRNVRQKKFGSSAPASPDKQTNKLAAQKSPVTLYTSECGRFCDEARQLLDERRIPYSSKDPQTSEENFKALEKLTGKRKVPVLVVGDLTLDGFNARQWNRALDDAGYAKAPVEARLPATGNP